MGTAGASAMVVFIVLWTPCSGQPSLNNLVPDKSSLSLPAWQTVVLKRRFAGESPATTPAASLPLQSELLWFDAICAYRRLQGFGNQHAAVGLLKVLDNRHPGAAHRQTAT